MRLSLIPSLLLLAALTALGSDYAERIAPLIDPAKLATLAARGANPRIQKVTYWLAKAKEDKEDPATVAADAVRLAGYTNALAAEMTKAALLRNLDIATQLGCLDAEGMAEMWKGNAPTVKRGQYRGQELSDDRILPRSKVPECREHLNASFP